MTLKKYICWLLAALLLFLCGCSGTKNTADDKFNEPPVSSPRRMRGVWISYLELASHDKTEAGFKQHIDTMFKTVSEHGFDCVFVHVRPNADALYRSEIFPFSSVLTGVQGADPGYDPLEFMVESAHALGLKIHAWINPYRVSNSINSVNELAENNPARIYINDGDPSNDNRVKIIPSADGKQAVFFNPSLPEVQKLIIDGVREIIESYDVDGIHIDDYFYPTSSLDFDINEYEEYHTSTTLPLSQEDWRRLQVDTLVSALYRTVHSKDGVIFGVSPSAHISKDGSDKNYNEQYANIAKWMREEKYIDYIAPQLYFGYEYPEEQFRFDNILNTWAQLERDDSVALYIGIGAYKIGTADAGTDEWQISSDILARQHTDALQSADGVIFYSYSSLFAQDEINNANLQNLCKYIN